jgi:hypothetical protein
VVKNPSFNYIKKELEKDENPEEKREVQKDEEPQYQSHSNNNNYNSSQNTPVVVSKN